MIWENLIPGTKVGKFHLLDEDNDESLTFSFVEGEGSEDNDIFEI